MNASHGLSRTIVGSKGVNCIGSVAEASSLGENVRSLLLSMNVSGIPMNLVTKDFDDKAATDVPPFMEGLGTGTAYPVNLLLIDLGAFAQFDALVKEGTIRTSKYNIARWSNPSSSLPQRYLPYLDNVNEIWVSTQFEYRSFASFSTVPIVVVPPCVVVKPTGGIQRADLKIDPDRKVFFANFSYLSASRKNPFGIIEAFSNAFWNVGRDRPQLVIRARHLNRVSELRSDLLSALKLVDGILIEDDFTRSEIDDLLNCIDVYVSLHRSIGFGMGLAEAMSLGKPAVATAYSGNLDFMNEENSYLVGYKLRRVRKEDNYYTRSIKGAFTTGFLWAEPDLAQASQAFKRVYDHWATAQMKGNVARETILKNFSPHATGALVRHRLNEIQLHGRPGNEEVAR